MKEEKVKDEKNCNDITFYRCTICGNLIIKLVDSGLSPQCCGRDMVELKAGETDAAEEKHVPVWRKDGCNLMIQVGEDIHPMSKEHQIQFILVKTNKGLHVRCFEATDEPEACFKLCKGEEVVAIYEYCNLHGLWIASEEEDSV